MGRALPGEDGKVISFPKLDIYNNRVFSEIGFLWSISIGDTTIYANHYSDFDHVFVIWDYDGDVLLIKKHGFSSDDNLVRPPHATDSIVYFTGSIWENATFGDTTITHNQNASRVYIAKYVDPEFAHPYVHPSDRQEQSIEWEQDLVFALADSPVTLTATATSGLPVVYTCNDNTIADVEGDRLHLLHEGTAIITATQPGDYYYLPAQPLTKTLLVGNADVDIVTDAAPQVYPNPATNVVYVNSNRETITSVRLVSSLGRQEQVTLTDNRIDIAHLPSGVYYLSVITPTNNYQYKIIKP